MRERLDVVDQRRPAEVARLGGEGRSQAWHAAASFQRLEHRRLLAADVGAGAGHDLHGHRPEQPGRAELGNCGQQPRSCSRVLLAQIDDRVLGLDEAGRDRHALDEQMRPQLHDVAVLDRPGLALVGVDDDDARARVAGRPSPTCGRWGSRRRRSRPGPTPRAPRAPRRSSVRPAAPRARRAVRSRRASRPPARGRSTARRWPRG